MITGLSLLPSLITAFNEKIGKEDKENEQEEIFGDSRVNIETFTSTHNTHTHTQKYTKTLFKKMVAFFCNASTANNFCANLTK